MTGLGADGVLRCADVHIGMLTPVVSVQLTTQRLVMEAAASRSFTPIHHDRDVSQAGGAPDVYAGVLLLQAILEQTLRGWMGPSGRLRRLALRITGFSCAGDVVECQGEVTGRDESTGRVELVLRQRCARGETATANAVVELADAR